MPPTPSQTKCQLGRQHCLCLIVASLALAGAQDGFAQRNPTMNAYFGDTHVHTAWSFDAFIYGTRTTPEEAYRYALGQAIQSPGGYAIQLSKPLDFSMVTDHAEFMGVVPMAQDPKSSIGKLPVAQSLLVRSKEDMLRVYRLMRKAKADPQGMPDLNDPALAVSVWSQVVAAADRYYQPGKFTTFAAYEWTSAPSNANLHRNIVFKDTQQIPDRPFTSQDSDRPEDLWLWMDRQRQLGHEVLAISHNANLSDGLMFPVETDMKGRPIDAAYAEQRMRNEPLSEVTQTKGTSETHPTLSPNDEFAGFEIVGQLLGGATRTPKLNGSYIREAYRNGIAMQEKSGFNPYKFGLVSGSDTHVSAGAYAENAYVGHHGTVDDTAAKRMSGEKQEGFDMREMSTGGLGGVWAEENTREAIFDAFKRKETFGTTGPRIQVRFFGGWHYPSQLLRQDNWLAAAYALGVPMGADLPPARARAPQFVVWALKDPDSGNLDRIQIVKGWTANGKTFEKVFDITWSGQRRPVARSGKLPAVGNTVDTHAASFTNTIGATHLEALWTDPQFDARQHAFYYARVLEIPTPRWTTYDAKTLNIAPPKEYPASIQERAYTSPIWYTPSATPVLPVHLTLAKTH